MKKYALILFFLSFFIFNLNLNITGSGDNTPARLLPFNLFSGRGFSFDDFAPLLIDHYPHIFQKFGNHYISSYPYLPGIVSIPIYLPLYLFLKTNNLTSLEDLNYYSFITEKLSASLFASLSVVAFFFLFKKIFKQKRASMIFALIFAFATQTFSISSQHLWQHTMSNLFFILSQICFVHALTNKTESKRYFLYSLLLAILCLFSRTIFLIYIPILLLSIWMAEKKMNKMYVLTALAGSTTFMSLNYYLYGLLIGTHAVSLIYFDPRSFLSNLAILLFSPARGILFYTPFFLFAFAAAFMLPKIFKEPKIKRLLLLLNLIFLSTILAIYSTYSLQGGWVWGDRYLTDGAVPATVLSYYFLSQYKLKALKIVFALSVFWSFIAQVIGVFFYPKGHWDSYPKNIDQSLERLWDFKDSPITRNLAAGPKLDGYYVLYYLVVGIEPRLYSDEDKKCSLENLGGENYLGYKSILIKITNHSNTDWTTAGRFPVLPTLPSGFMPPIIKNHSSIVTRLLLIPPSNKNNNSLIVSLVQKDLLQQKEISRWNSYCMLKIPL